MASMVEEASNPDNSVSIINFSQSDVSSQKDSKKGKLCLSMIVKNESKIIERLICSVLPIIDSYCICDTGSTDNTIEIIQRYMEEAGKPGEVIQEPFKNFGYNRTYALNAAEQWGEYALLLDADMILNIGHEFQKESLVSNGYNVKQIASTMEYYNLRIVKTGIGAKCVGPTHEYYDVPGGTIQCLDSIWISDIGDGGAKADKFERDIRLLTEGLKEEPTNARYHFYLANSYRDLGKYNEAIEWYKKRAALGGWREEVFYAKYEIGNCYDKLKDYDKAIYWWLEAYNHHSGRAESLYEIVKHYRIEGKHTLAQQFLDIAKTIPYPKHDLLFIKKNVYEYDLYFEQSILAFYTGVKLDPMKYLLLLGKGIHTQILLQNYKFYAKKLIQIGGSDVDFTDSQVVPIRGLEEPLQSSSPSILPDGDGYIMNVRYVNYKIRKDGGYDFKHSDGKIISLNRAYKLDKALCVRESHMFDTVENESLRYMGVEDIKLFNHEGDIRFFGTVEHPNGRITIGKGIYDRSQSMLKSIALSSPNDRRCEKNWCYLHASNGQLRVVYEWFPLTLFTEDMALVSKDTGVPPFFQHVRGSSHGFLTGEDIWFLCHVVDCYSSPRHYYHLFVILDANTLTYKRHSSMFKFHGDPIEYALGLIVEKERILISYSRMDASSAVHSIDRDIVEKELF